MIDGFPDPDTLFLQGGDSELTGAHDKQTIHASPDGGESSCVNEEDGVFCGELQRISLKDGVDIKRSVSNVAECKP